MFNAQGLVPCPQWIPHRCYFFLVSSPCLVWHAYVTMSAPSGRYPWLQNDKALCLQCTHCSRSLLTNMAGILPGNQTWLYPSASHSSSLISVLQHPLNSPSLRISCLPPCLPHETASPPSPSWRAVFFISVSCTAHSVIPGIKQLLIKGNQVGLRPELASCFIGFQAQRFSPLLPLSICRYLSLMGFRFKKLSPECQKLCYLISSLPQPWGGRYRSWSADEETNSKTLHGLSPAKSFFWSRIGIKADQPNPHHNKPYSEALPLNKAYRVDGYLCFSPGTVLSDTHYFLIWFTRS